MRMASRQEISILAGLILVGRIVAEQATGIGAPATTVPMLLVDGRPVIDVRVNGRGPYQMVLDTGAVNTAVSPEWATRRTEQIEIDLRIGAQT